MWHCRCDCGQEYDATSYNLRKGITWHCGCQRRKDLTNKKFNFLTALYPAGHSGHGGPYWVCRCDCGRIVERTVKGTRGKECACPDCREKILRAHTSKMLDNRDEKTGANSIQVDHIRSGKLTKINTSGIRGVRRLRGKWMASGSIKGRSVYLGVYEDIEDARKARERFVEERYGEAPR